MVQEILEISLITYTENTCDENFHVHKLRRWLIIAILFKNNEI